MLRGSGGDPEGIRGDPGPKRGIRLPGGLRFVGDPPPPVSPFIILKKEIGVKKGGPLGTEGEFRSSRILWPAAV